MCDVNQSPADTVTELMVWFGVLQPVTTDQKRQYATTGWPIVAILARIYELDPSSRIELGAGTRRSPTIKEAEDLMEPLLSVSRDWFDSRTQSLYDEFARLSSKTHPTPSPPRNEDELLIWLMAAMKHPTTGLHIRLRKEILAQTQVDLDPLFVTSMVEVWLHNGTNMCLDWNTQVHLCPERKFNMGGEFKYIPQLWNKEFGMLDNPSAKYAISAIPWFTQGHRTDFLPENSVDSNWSMAEPRLDAGTDYKPPVATRGFPNPLTSFSQLGFSRHPKVARKVPRECWVKYDLSEKSLLEIGRDQMSAYGDAFLGELQPASERVTGKGIRDMRYRVLEHTDACRVYHYPHLLVFIAGGSLLFRFNGASAVHDGAELVVGDPFTPTLVTGRNSDEREEPRILMHDTSWTVYKVPL